MRSVIFLALQCLGLVGAGFILWFLHTKFRNIQVFWTFAAVLSSVLFISIFVVSQSWPVFEDFVPVYWQAGRAVLSNPSDLITLLGKGVDGGFVNLPIMAYFFAPFALLSPYVAGGVFTGLGVIAVVAAWWLVGNHFKFDSLERGLSLLLFAGFGPLVYSFREGNLSHFLLPVLVLVLLELRRNKEFSAGVLLGLAALIKPPLILLCLYAAFRFRGQIVLGAVTVLMAFTAVSVAVFGWDTHILWFTANLGTFSQDVIAASNSHSVSSVLARFHYGIEVLGDWNPLPMPTGLRFAILATIGGLGLLAVWAAAPWKRWLVGKDEFEADLMLIIVFVLFASTLTWTHYYSWLLLPIMWLWRSIRTNELKRFMVPLLALFVLMSALAYVRTAPPAALDSMLPLIFTYLLAAGLGIYGLLVISRRQILLRNSASTGNSVNISRVHINDRF